jgi:hypothetical protein
MEVWSDSIKDRHTNLSLIPPYNFIPVPRFE